MQFISFKPGLVFVLAAAFATSSPSPDSLDEKPSPAEALDLPDSKREVILEKLRSTEHAGVKNTEVVVSHITISPNTYLPKH